MRLLCFLLIVVIAASCSSYKAKYPYSLKDFRQELRPGLEKIITNGGMCDDFFDNGSNGLRDKYVSFIDSNATLPDLQRMIFSEHPLLRAYGFKLLCRRESPLLNDVLLNHLDDTAIISHCNGEFGPDFTTVADNFLQTSKGKTRILKKDVIATVVKKHPYLINAAIFFQYRKDSMQGYYHELRDIVLHKYPHHYAYEEMLLKKLSVYKNFADTSYIKTALKIRWRDDQEKFLLVENNPIQPYFFVIEKFYESLKHSKYFGDLQQRYHREDKFERVFDSFISALLAYKSKRSAEIIESILMENLYPEAENARDNLLKYSFHYFLLKKIEQYNCNVYVRIKKEIMFKAKAYERKYALSPLESSAGSLFIKESIYW